jgi:hypothetical protein
MGSAVLVVAGIELGTALIDPIVWRNDAAVKHSSSGNGYPYKGEKQNKLGKGKRHFLSFVYFKHKVIIILTD